ncbi:hypothetical protein R1flu_007088 [Riccia fluitans]|uniref:Uncharacterized protein n=1 Tax=Riccia fluitans TaxID=41844 RepID=A0ABD1YYZ3_9MARC
MLRNWKIATYNKAARIDEGRTITVDDLQTPGADGRLNSPRSLQACLYLGIDPAEVVHRESSTAPRREKQNYKGKN